MLDFNLKGMQASAEFQIQQLAGGIDLAKDWRDFRDEVREICDYFLTLSAASIYVDVKPSMFFANVYRCANNWLRFISTSQDHYNKHPLLTYNAPLFAAIISNHHSLLSDIAKALPQTPTPKVEYADNFHLCWLHLLLAQNKCTLTTEVETHLNAYENSCDDTTKLNMFKALLGLDDLTTNDFWPLFESALQTYDDEIEAKSTSVATSITKFIAHRYIWLEGLAFLHLVSAKGAATPISCIKYCPVEALKKMPDNFYSTDWLLVPFKP